MKRAKRKIFSVTAANARARSRRERRSALLGLLSLLCLVLALALLALARDLAPDGQKQPLLLAEASALTLTPTAEPSPTPKPTASPTPVPQAAQTIRIRAFSSELDAEIQVLDDQGEPIRGVIFFLRLTGPDGLVLSLTTDREGRIYCEDLPSGAYSVSLAPTEAYVLPEPLLFTVREKLNYEPIADLRALAEVRPVEELPAEELQQVRVEQSGAVEVESIDTTSLPSPTPEQETEAPQTAEPEAESEPEPGAEATDELLVVGGDEPDASDEPEITYIYPAPYYEYTYELGPEGHLLLADGTESDVFPVEEDGVLTGGRRERLVIVRVDAEGERSEVEAVPEEIEEGVSYEEETVEEWVAVLNDDGSALHDYLVTATLVTPDPIPVEPEPTPEGGGSLVVVGQKSGWQEEEDGLCFYDLNGQRVTGLKEIDGKLYYFNGAGVKARAIGIDVSYFNGAIDWKRVKAYGIDFVIVRLAGRTWGGGVLFEDELSYRSVNGAGRYLQEARAAGLQVGAYVWSSAVNTNEAVEEASLALQILGGMPLDLPLYIDMEYSGNYPCGRADRLTVQQRGEIVQAFCATVSSGGYRPGVYAGQNYWGSALSYDACAGYSIWMASYTANQRVPASFPWHYDVWQCSASASIRGVSGACDLDIIF